MSRLAPHAHGHDLRNALIATLFFGAAAGIFGATLNNYLSEAHGFDAAARGWLEVPRELPGFLIMFITGALLAVASESQMAALAMLLTGAGAAGLGFLSPTIAAVVVFVAIWSLGDHIIFAVEGPIGLRLASGGREGRRLGQFGGARNLGTIAGVGLVFGLAQVVGDRYDVFYGLAAACAVLAGVCYASLRMWRTGARSKRLVLKRRYSLFYVISALFGIRKQIFLAFGAWVLIELHGVSVSTIALLYFIAATLGVVMRPLLGEVIDWLGERTVLAVDELLLLVVCLAYAFASDLLPEPFDLWLLYAAYVADWVLYALRVARTTYLGKIAEDPADITPTIATGITIDHAVAISLPVVSGYVWEAFGFRWVFLLAGAIALVGFFVCLRVRVPTPAGNDSGAAQAA
ncbi:MAG TPA: MFS transporter [Thermoanaerobaculales bacterium]|nr:MFS transporter [Thermoanaerobaculales bacterium]HPA81623.1 MFS transporter [Thermoanaerobaculales bacterium]HQL30789.1 MFS transporter [Thermoanaerobaculales bacterium]HQN96956.1 MFS transporter [Thermoanaerobaculales bacterium]HQP44507.1 MFS transporter [Thermoanaerobaculales bacterium]